MISVLKGVASTIVAIIHARKASMGGRLSENFFSVRPVFPLRSDRPLDQYVSRRKVPIEELVGEEVPRSARVE
jgi:hypothetical protein